MLNKSRKTQILISAAMSSLLVLGSGSAVADELVAPDLPYALSLQARMQESLHQKVEQQIPAVIGEMENSSQLEQFSATLVEQQEKKSRLEAPAVTLHTKLATEKRMDKQS